MNEDERLEAMSEDDEVLEARAQASREGWAMHRGPLRDKWQVAAKEAWDAGERGPVCDYCSMTHPTRVRCFDWRSEVRKDERRRINALCPHPTYMNGCDSCEVRRMAAVDHLLGVVEWHQSRLLG